MTDTKEAAARAARVAAMRAAAQTAAGRVHALLLQEHIDKGVVVPVMGQPVYLLVRV